MNTENQNTNSGKNKDQELGALWTKKSKAGATFLSGYLLNEEKQKVNVVIFKNSFKKAGEKTPDYRIYLSELKQDVSNSPSQSNNQQDTNQDQVSDEEIPF